MKTHIGVACVAVLLGTQVPGIPVRAQSEKFRQMITAEGTKYGGSGDYLLTFSTPVALPGLSLAPGSYIFRRPAYTTIQVASAAGEPYSMFSMVTTRRETASEGYAIVLGTPAVEGAPRRILALFEPGEKTGLEFVYPK
jgi:hypothetical protein